MELLGWESAVALSGSAATVPKGKMLWSAWCLLSTGMLTTARRSEWSQLNPKLSLNGQKGGFRFSPGRIRTAVELGAGDVDFLGSSVAEAKRRVHPTFGDGPSFGSCLADEQDLELSVLKTAVSQGPGLQHRRSPLHRRRSYGTHHQLC